MPTIGVLITLPDPAGSELDDYRRSIGDQGVEEVPSHITLIPPTEVADADLDEIGTHLAAAARRHEAFRVLLRGTATFRPVSPVVFVALAEGISQTEQLAADLRRGPLAVELQYPYHPHVTVAHHLDDDVLDKAFDDLAGFESAFEVTGFDVFTHDEDAGWRATRGFELQEA